MAERVQRRTSHVDHKKIETARSNETRVTYIILYVLVPVRACDESPIGHAGHGAREQTGPADATQSVNKENNADTSNR